MPYSGEIIELGDLVSEKRPVMSLVRNGEPITMSGWVDNGSCPVGIKAEVARAYRTWRKRAEADDAGAGMILNRDLLMAVLIGIEETEADIIAGNDDNVVRILTALEWMKEADAEGEATGMPEASQPTTETSSPDSTSATEPEIG